MSLVITRAPRPILRTVVERFWAIEPEHDALGSPASREHVLPTGQMHLAFRLSGGPLELFERHTDPAGFTVGDAVIGGARSDCYIRDVSRRARSVGAQLRPGAAEALFSAPAHEFAGRHTTLDDLWPGEVGGIREQLASAATLHQRIDRLEGILTARLSARALVPHPAVATALEQLPASSSIQRIVHATGYSHRALIALFRRAVGLTPGDYRRVLRFRSAVRMLTSPAAQPLAAIAAETGYSDQAHFTREFRSFAGVTPGEYRRRTPERPYHVAAGQFRSRPDGRPQATVILAAGCRRWQRGRQHDCT